MTDPSRRDPGWEGMGTGWAVVSTLVAGILIWGGIGYLIDRLLGTPSWFLATGMILGAGGSVYLIWLKYGRENRSP